MNKDKENYKTKQKIKQKMTIKKTKIDEIKSKA